MSAALASPQLLVETFLRTLEEAAFAFAEPTPEPPPFSGELLEARLAWSGPAAAEMTLVVERGFAASLAAALVGDDDPDHARAVDALGELLNMVAGPLAHDVSFGAATHLGVPRVRGVGSVEWSAARAAAQTVVSFVEENGNRIDLALAEANAGAGR